MSNFFKRIAHAVTLKSYREEIAANQKQLEAQLQRNYEQLFLSNPVLVVDKVQMYLPLFYVDHIQKTIFRTGSFYEQETLLYLQKRYGNFKRILDIGTNIGNHMLYYCSQMEATAVYCFEPNPLTRKTLEKNIELNHLERIVTVYPVALGAANGKGIQKDFTLANTGMNRIEEVKDAAAEGGTVDIVSLDGYGFTAIDFIKIDVEGFELDVLSGAGVTFRNNKAVVLIEVFADNQERVDRLMEEYGYRKTQVLEDYNCIYEPVG